MQHIVSLLKIKQYTITHTIEFKRNNTSDTTTLIAHAFRRITIISWKIKNEMIIKLNQHAVKTTKSAALCIWYDAIIYNLSKRLSLIGPWSMNNFKNIVNEKII